jgi:hypothetical protein
MWVDLITCHTPVVSHEYLPNKSGVELPTDEARNLPNELGDLVETRRHDSMAM